MLHFPENDAERLQRAATFDTIAELYNQARSGYPEELFDKLFELARLEPRGAEVVEIGPGTGQASVPLARRGCRLTCIEIGVNLAAIAARNLAEFPQAKVVNTRFEDWAPGQVFDMLFSKDAWHWFDPQIKYAHAFQLLRTGGVLAISASAHAFPPGYDTFFEQIQDCYEAIGAPRMQFPRPPPEAISDLRGEIEASGYFDDVRVERHLWSREFTADQHVDLMSTASDHRLIEPEKRERLFGEMRRLINARPGRRIRKHFLTILHVATRKG